MKNIGNNTWITIDMAPPYGATFVWNGRLTVKVYSGSTELDVISFMEQPTYAQVEAAIKRRIRESQDS